MQIQPATKTPVLSIQLSKLSGGDVFTLWHPSTYPELISDQAYLIMDDPSRNKEGRVSFVCLETGKVSIRDGETLVVKVECTLLKFN